MPIASSFSCLYKSHSPITYLAGILDTTCTNNTLAHSTSPHHHDQPDTHHTLHHQTNPPLAQTSARHTTAKMCEYETHVMLCVHVYYSVKAPCHDKRNYCQCFGQDLYHDSDVHYQEYACDDCKDWYNLQTREVQAAQIPIWRAQQQQYRVDAEAARQQKELEQAEERRAVQEMLREGGRGGGSGSGSGSAGGRSSREMRKPYQR